MEAWKFLVITKEELKAEQSTQLRLDFDEVVEFID